MHTAGHVRTTRRSAERELLPQLLLDFLFPRRCFICDKILDPWEVADGLHQECKADVYKVGDMVCVHCGMPLKKNTDYCGNCTQKSYITQGKALYRYKGKIKYTMYRFKYSNKREYANAFAKEAFEHYGDWIRANKVDVIIPVPMNRRKKRARGYNQAECFAKALSKLCQVPYSTRFIYRSKDTNPMKTLTKVQRYNNLKNAFHMYTNVLDYRKNALVVDDIYTSGATAESVASVLKRAGFEKVFFLSICIGKGL